MLAPQPSYHRCWTAVKTRIHTFARSLSEGARGCTLLEYSVRLKHRDSPRMLRPPGPTRIDPEAASKHQELQDSTINQPPLLQHCSGASKRRPSKARLPSTKRNAVSPPSSGALSRRFLPTSAMPEHQAVAVTPADACMKADVEHAIVPCAWQQGSLHPRERAHARSRCNGRTAPPDGHAELLA